MTMSLFVSFKDSALKEHKLAAAAHGKALKAVMNVALTYAAVLFGGNVLYRYLSGILGHTNPMDFLSYLSSAVETLGLLALIIRINLHKSVAGLSGKTMLQYGLAYFLRMLCVQDLLMMQWSFEILDVMAWIMVMFVVWAVFCSPVRSTYNEEEDAFPQGRLVLGCLLLACICRLLGLMDMQIGQCRSFMWTACLFLETSALLPQVWMIAKMGVRVEALTSHFVAATALSRMLDVGFWYYAWSIVAPRDGGFNCTGSVILFCHLVHAVLLCDFMYHYLKLRISKGMMEAMELPNEEV